MKSFYKIKSEIQGKIKLIFDKLTKNPDLKKTFVLLAGGGGGGGAAGGGG